MQKFNFFQNKIQSSGQRVDNIYVSQRLCLISMISTEEEGDVGEGRGMTIIQRLYCLLTKVLMLHEVRIRFCIISKVLMGFLKRLEGARRASKITSRLLTQATGRKESWDH